MTPRASFATIDQVTDWFAARGVPFNLVEHPATHRAADGMKIREWLDMPGVITKSLLCRDGAGQLIMIIAPTTARVNLKAAAHAAGATGRLSFAAPEAMVATYGVGPGHLSPLALINDHQRVTHAVVVDQTVADAPCAWGHPLHNEASVGVAPAELGRFIAAHGPAPIIAAVTAHGA